MKKQKQFEALAVLDGYEAGDKITFPQYFYKESKIFTQLPNYDSHDALQRIIDGLDRDGLYDGLECEYGEYVHFLICEVTHPFLSYVATPAQKREAILKAKGLWSDD